MKTNARAVACAALLLTSLLSGASAQEMPRPRETMTLNVACLPGKPLALRVAQEQGLFAKRGIEVKARVATNSDELRGALADGSADVAHAAVDNAVALIEKAHVDVAVVVGGEASANELFAQPEIHAIEELRGKTVIVDAPTTAYAIQLKKILRLHGMEAGRDYQIQAVGSTPQRLAAMREHKEYAATILNPPASLVAKRDGFVSLGTAQAILGPYQGISGFTRRDWAAQHREALTTYIAALVEAQRWLLNRVNKAQVLALLQGEYKLSPELAAEMYEQAVVSPLGLQVDAKIDRTGFENVLRLRADIEHTWAGETPAPEKYLDLSYYEAAIKQ